MVGKKLVGWRSVSRNNNALTAAWRRVPRRITSYKQEIPRNVYTYEYKYEFVFSTGDEPRSQPVEAFIELKGAP